MPRDLPAKLPSVGKPALEDSHVTQPRQNPKRKAPASPDAGQGGPESSTNRVLRVVIGCFMFWTPNACEFIQPMVRPQEKAVTTLTSSAWKKPRLKQRLSMPRISLSQLVSHTWTQMPCPALLQKRCCDSLEVQSIQFPKKKLFDPIDGWSCFVFSLATLIYDDARSLDVFPRKQNILASFGSQEWFGETLHQAWCRQEALWRCSRFSDQFAEAASCCIPACGVSSGWPKWSTDSLLNLVQAFCRSHPRLLDKINSVYLTLVDATVKINEQYITGIVHGYTKEWLCKKKQTYHRATVHGRNTRKTNARLPRCKPRCESNLKVLYADATAKLGAYYVSPNFGTCYEGGFKHTRCIDLLN